MDRAGTRPRRTDTRRGARARSSSILTADEVLPVLRSARARAAANLRRPQSSRASARARSCAASARTDLDLARGLPLPSATAYDRPFPKSKTSAWCACQRSSCRSSSTRSRRSPGPWLFPDTRRCDADEDLAAGGHPPPSVEARRHRDRLRPQVPAEGVRARRVGTLTPSRTTCPSCRMKLWPKGQVREHPISRHEAHPRLGAPHARREPRLGAEAARPLGPEDHRASVRAHAPRVHVGRGEPSPLRPRPARAHWQRFAGLRSAWLAAGHNLDTVSCA